MVFKLATHWNWQSLLLITESALSRSFPNSWKGSTYPPIIVDVGHGINDMLVLTGLAIVTSKLPGEEA